MHLRLHIHLASTALIAFVGAFTAPATAATSPQDPVVVPGDLDGARAFSFGVGSDGVLNVGKTLNSV
jgi:hypothetical protein